MEKVQTPKKLPSRAQAIDRLWREGILHWKLDSAQKQAYDTFIKNEATITVLEISRRVGKSYTLSAIAIETAIKIPNASIHYACSTGIMVSKFIIPIFRTLLQDCPEDLRPEYKKHDRAYYFKNGSKIQIEGCDDGNADRLRGTASHLAIVDEAGFIKDLKYVVYDILLPQFLTTSGRMIMSSTPPDDLNHPFIDEFIPKAQAQRVYFKLSMENYFELVEQDPPHFRNRINKKAFYSQIEQQGIDSPTVQREYFCKHVVGNEGSVIPEITAELEREIVQEWKRPETYDTYVSMDIGSANDFTAILFGYYDFRNAKLIIEDEYLCRYEEANSKNIALVIKSKEADLWKDLAGNPVKPYLRVADNNAPILLNDLAIQYDLFFITSRKDDKKAAINDLRTRLQEKNIIINPKCVNLLDHLRYATWGSTGKSFKRHADYGHFDFVDALIFLTRNILWDKNPYGPTKYSSDMFVPLLHQNPMSKTAESLKKLFKLGKNKHGR